jgi:hypothetical protein
MQITTGRTLLSPKQSTRAKYHDLIFLPVAIGQFVVTYLHMHSMVTEYFCLQLPDPWFEAISTNSRAFWVNRLSRKRML